MTRPLVVFALAALALCAAADVSPSSNGGPSLYAPPPEEAATKLERRRLNPSSRRRSSSFGSYSSYSPSAGVTVTRDNRGYGQRVKDAVGGFVFGLILVCFMPCCIFWNEKNYVYTTKMIEQVAKIAVTVKDPENPEDREDAEGGCCTFNCSPGRDAQHDLVHTVGKIQSNDFSKDFLSVSGNPGITISGHSLWKADAEVYQWFIEEETKTEGDDEITIKTFKKKWVSKDQGELVKTDVTNADDYTPNASAAWNKVEPLAGDSGCADNATLGKYKIPEGLFKDNGGPRNVKYTSVITGDTKPLTLDEITELSPVADKETFYLSDVKSFEDPPIGSVRVKIEQALKDGETVTVMAGENKPPENLRNESEQAAMLGADDVEDSTPLAFTDFEVKGCGICFPDQTLSANTSNESGGFWAMEVGDISAPDLMAHEKSDAVMRVWLIRILCFFLLFLGFYLMLNPVAEIFRPVPILSSIVGAGVLVLACACTCVCCCTETAVIWFAVRPVTVSLLLLLIYGYIFMLSAWLPAADEDGSM